MCRARNIKTAIYLMARARARERERESVGPCEAAMQSSRQVGLIELGAATVIHNARTQGSRASEQAWAEKVERRRSLAPGRKAGKAKRNAAARARVCAHEAWFSFDYRYGMHLRCIMQPRGGT